jgi:internalin A
MGVNVNLWIDNTAVSDAGLRHLKGLTRLELLQLYNTGITDAGTAEILKALPGLNFYP